MLCYVIYVVYNFLITYQNKYNFCLRTILITTFKSRLLDIVLGIAHQYEKFGLGVPRTLVTLCRRHVLDTTYTKNILYVVGRSLPLPTRMYRGLIAKNMFSIEAIPRTFRLMPTTFVLGISLIFCSASQNNRGPSLQKILVLVTIKFVTTSKNFVTKENPSYLCHH